MPKNYIRASQREIKPVRPKSTHFSSPNRQNPIWSESDVLDRHKSSGNLTSDSAFIDDDEDISLDTYSRSLRCSARRLIHKDQISKEEMHRRSMHALHSVTQNKSFEQSNYVDKSHMVRFSVSLM